MTVPLATALTRLAPWWVHVAGAGFVAPVRGLPE